MIRLSHLFAFGIVLGACSGSSEPTASVGLALTGPIEVRMAEDEADVDDSLAPASLEPTRIVVTITRIDARVEQGGVGGDDDGWATLSLAVRTVDLLSLHAGGFVSLGVTQLPAGGIERLRLFVSSSGPNYVVTADGQSHPLLVPSGIIRINGDFDAEACAVGQITLAFAGRESIEVHPLGVGVDVGLAVAVPPVDAAASTDAGAAGQWVLRPVIRVTEAEMQEASCPDDGDRGRGHGHGDDGRHSS
jgi:hypothetical protein